MSASPEPGTSDLRDYLDPLWRHRWLIGILVAVATVGTYLYFKRQPPVYQTSTQVFVASQSVLGGQAGAGSGDADRVIANQIPVLKSEAVADRVARRIGFQGTGRDLLADVTVTPDTGSDYITITARAGSADAAAKLADAFAQAFIDLRRADRQLASERTLAALRQRLAEARGPGTASLRRALQRNINSLELALSTPSANAQQVDSAEVPTLPISPTPRRNAMFAFLLSLLLGTIVAYALERTDPRIRTAADAELAFGLPVLATIPRRRRVVARVDGRPTVPEGLREAFWSLRGALDLIAEEQPLRTILVTSTVPGEGKSTVVLNLALVYAEAGLNVAVLECDTRHPSLAALMGVEPEPGLGDVMANSAPLEAVVQRVPVHEWDAAEPSVEPALRPLLASLRGSFDEDRVIEVITSGRPPADPPAVFSSAAFPALLERLASDHDLVLVDAPPLLGVSEGSPLISATDGTVVVCRMRSVTRDGARRARALMARVPGRHVLGLAVNAAAQEDLGYRDTGSRRAYAALPLDALLSRPRRP